MYHHSSHDYNLILLNIHRLRKIISIVVIFVGHSSDSVNYNFFLTDNFQRYNPIIFVFFTLLVTFH